VELRILSALAVVFAAAGMVIAVAGLSGRDRKLVTELWQLYRTEFAVVALVLVPVVVGGFLLYAALLVFAWRAAFEVARLLALPLKGALALTAILGATATIIAAPAFGLAGVWMAALATACAVAVLAIGDGSMRNRLATGAAIALPGLFVAHVALAWIGAGLGWIVVIYATTEINDAFALLTGKLIGRHPFGRLSPHKTWEGLGCGFICGGIAGIALARGLVQASLTDAVPAIALILAAGILGDLAASAAKRWKGVKDFVPVHPALGGVLDIYDSFLAAVPVFYYVYAWNL
jgi:phosphatidate cytidylyltransferase